MGNKGCCRADLEEYGADNDGTVMQGAGKPMMKGPNMGRKRNDDSQASKDQEAEDLDEYDEGVTENLMNPGKKVSMADFTILKVIGRGSFGKVYLVRHIES